MAATDQRPFCSGCHLMQEAALTHKAGTHADVACNDCHVPPNLLAKLPYKAGEGLRDVMSNLSGKDISYPTSTQMRATINNNCKSCHAPTNTRVAVMDSKAYCVDCHRNLAHMRYKPVSTRMVAYE
jgi:cytochrome c nitrite reductase small subunit